MMSQEGLRHSHLEQQVARGVDRRIAVEKVVIGRRGLHSKLPDEFPAERRVIELVHQADVHCIALFEMSVSMQQRFVVTDRYDSHLRLHCEGDEGQRRMHVEGEGNGTGGCKNSRQVFFPATTFRACSSWPRATLPHNEREVLFAASLQLGDEGDVSVGGHVHEGEGKGRRRHVEHQDALSLVRRHLHCRYIRAAKEKR
eukprot:756013-Hanusia_phi.AAC.9